MVPIVENWADVRGTLLDVKPSQQADDFVTLELKVSDVKNVKGFKNLLDDKKGETLSVNVKRSIVQDMELKPGASVSSRVRMAGPGRLFAHPEHVKVE